MAVGAVGTSGGSAGSGAALSAEELEQRAQEAVDAYCALATEFYNGICRVGVSRFTDFTEIWTGSASTPSNLMKSPIAVPSLRSKA